MNAHDGHHAARLSVPVRAPALPWTPTTDCFLLAAGLAAPRLARATAPADPCKKGTA